MQPKQFREMISSMTGNKGVGMTEPEWAQIVHKNALLEMQQHARQK